MPAKGDYDEDADRHAATKTALGRQNAQLLRQVQQDRDLIHFQVRVVFVIAHQCDPYRGQLEISQQQLADQCAATKTGVQNALAALIHRFYLNRVRLGSNDAPARYEPRIHSSQMPIGCDGGSAA